MWGERLTVLRTSVEGMVLLCGGAVYVRVCVCVCVCVYTLPRGDSNV